MLVALFCIIVGLVVTTLVLMTITAVCNMVKTTMDEYSWWPKIRLIWYLVGCPLLLILMPCMFIYFTIEMLKKK